MQLNLVRSQEDSNERISRAILNMSIAFLVSKRGTCQRAQVGCVITQHNRIVSTGYNGALLEHAPCELNCDLEKGCKHAVHAEANAIAFAAREGIILENSTIYSTTQPCYECAKLIIQAGIKSVYYCIPYRLEDGLNILRNAGIEVNVVGINKIDKYVRITIEGNKNA